MSAPEGLRLVKWEWSMVWRGRRSGGRERDFRKVYPNRSALLRDLKGSGRDYRVEKRPVYRGPWEVETEKRKVEAEFTVATVALPEPLGGVR